MDKKSKLNNTLFNIYSYKMDEMEKKFAITSQSMVIPNKLSTGYLILDLVLGGGIASATMVQISGKEKGGKTTSCLTVLGAAVKSKIPIISYWDVENALNDPSHVEAIIKRPIREIFYSKPRRARLYQEAILEDFYLTNRYLMKSLPDKLYHHDAKNWFFVFDANKLGRKQMSDFGFTNYDKTLFKNTGRLWVPLEKDMAGIQGIIFCDSYPALVTRSDDDSDEENKAMALNARAFSDNIKKIAGRLKKKAFVVVGVNQIRENPAARFGNPLYEPGGTFLRYSSSVRIQQMPRVVPQGWSAGSKQDGGKTSQYGDEKSVISEGKFDRYAYIHVENTKNKIGPPFLSSMMRIWISDHLGKPNGYCPVYDTYQYLKLTGRIEGGPSKFIVNYGPLAKKKIAWLDFKQLILGHFFNNPEIIKKAEKAIGIKNTPDIRKELFKEIRTRKCYDLLTTKSSDEDDLEN